MTLTDAFRDQAGICAQMSSPFMGRLLTILADNWPADSALAASLATYKGDIGPAGHSLPLRVAGGLHALVLQGKDQGLTAAYPPNTVDDATLTTAVLAALTAHSDALMDWTRSAPQTNEVRRSAALIAAAHVARARFDLPFILSELGASGGLNLNWDRYALAIRDQHFGAEDPVITLTPDWTGPLPPDTAPQVAARAGVDLNPLDPQNDADRLRLSAYLWADQPHRLALTHAAAAVQTTLIAQGDAIDWLETRLAQDTTGHLHLIQHTVAWQYFPAEAQARGQALIEAAGARATPDAPLGWLQMESDGPAPGAALTLRLWPGDLTLHLGRADFHGRWIKWDYPDA